MANREYCAYYAHTPGDQCQESQDLVEHLQAVAEGTKRRCAKFGAGSWGEAAGLLHDIGKFSDAFQAYLQGEGPGGIDHSTAGAKLATARYETAGHLLAAPIAGHHTGLANATEPGERIPLAERLKLPVPDYSAHDGRIALPELTPPRMAPHPTAAVAAERRGLQLATFSRMVFGALIDADWSDTSAYYGNAIEPRWPTIVDLRAAFDRFYDDLVTGAAKNDLNRVRRTIMAAVRERAGCETGVTTLNVPTGGGKTIITLGYGLDHAAANKLDRVIYVAPYTAIIDQTADVFRKAVAPYSDAVIEHHTGYREPRTREQRVIAEAWSAPIIVSTAVQFFESLYTDRPGRARKIHNIANSVVILDEAQSLPVELLRPCVAILDELARNYGASIVLCTATQPALVERADEPARSFFGGFRNVRELAPNPNQLAKDLKRFSLRIAGDLADNTIAAEMLAQPNGLTIVNTRRHAQRLYDLISHVDGAAHLSTMMCPAHRRERLTTIRERLNPKKPKPVYLVATSLIEAGVDVDFRAVWRAVAGLDQIVQARWAM